VNRWQPFHERGTSSRTSGQPAGSITRRRPAPAAASAPVGLHLKPGQKGTKHLVEQYGDRLVSVRYRYHAARKKRLETAELIVAEADWEPRFAPDETVALRVAFSDLATRRRVKQAGGTGVPTKRCGACTTTASWPLA
jgi:hypothetical protein